MHKHTQSHASLRACITWSFFRISRIFMRMCTEATKDAHKGTNRRMWLSRAKRRSTAALQSDGERRLSRLQDHAEQHRQHHVEENLEGVEGVSSPLHSLQPKVKKRWSILKCGCSRTWDSSPSHRLRLFVVMKWGRPNPRAEDWEWMRSRDWVCQGAGGLPDHPHNQPAGLLQKQMWVGVMVPVVYM